MGLMDFLRPKNDAVQAKPKSTLTSLFEGPEGGDRLRYLGAYFRDLDNGGMTDAQGEARQMIAQEHEAAAKKKTQAAAQQAISEAMKGAYGDDGKFDPMLFAQNMLGSGELTDAGDILGFAKEATPQPVKPQYVEGPDGIYEIAGGQSRRIQDYPQKPVTTPGQINPTTGRWEWAPGYLEGQGQLSSVRRAPPRPRAGGASGSGAVPPPPPGFRIVRP